jgi:hypothetical protein
MNKILLNFFNLEKPTTKQIIEVLKIMIKDKLMITDDLYTVNPLTGEKIKKINIVPTQIDEVSDLDIITDIAKIEAEKVKAELTVTISKLSKPAK